MILCRRAEERDSPDINFLDSIGKSTCGFGDSRSERIEVANDDRDGGDGLSFQILLVGWDRTSKDTCI